MILMYRIIQGLIGIDLSIFTFRSRDTFPTTRCHQYNYMRFLCIQYITMLEPIFYTCRIANMWNDLPSEIIKAPSLNCFKSLLGNHWTILCIILINLISYLIG